MRPWYEGSWDIDNFAVPALGPLLVPPGEPLKITAAELPDVATKEPSEPLRLCAV